MVSLSAVTVPSWPSCSDCLSWSSDSKDLAVAGGENVYLVSLQTQEQADTGHVDKWQVHTLRANVFSSRSEWPYQTLAPLHIFSIGEELSIPTVSALAWSPAGIGVHGRSVLGILTTNLVLSIWESDGTAGKWDRTCVVNQYLQEYHKEISSENNVNGTRCACRIRSFVWIDPVWPAGTDDNSGPSLKRAVHHLAVADDGNNILLLEIKRLPAAGKRNLMLKVAAGYELPRFTPKADEIEKHSLFSLAMNSHVTVRKMKNAPWKKISLDSTTRDRVSELTVFRRYETISLQLALSSEGLNANSKSAPGVVILQNAGPPDIAAREEQNSQTDLLKVYGKQLQPLCQEFDAKYKLGGNYRLHNWGEALAPNQQSAAVCVTMHPTDIIEYATPAYRKSTVLIRREAASSSSGQYDLQHVYKKLLTYILQQHSNAQLTKLDRSILRAAAAFAYVRFADDATIQDASRRALEQVVAAGQQAIENGLSIPESDSRSGFVTSSAADVEDCEICHAQIPFQDPSYARCLTGHLFTRCNISFVPIQEPAISKYCSDCGKQFLDLAKLEPPADQSFAPSLFEEFDRCPYCFGLFRG